MNITPNLNLEKWEHSALTFEHQCHNISYHHSAASLNQPILFIHGFPTASWDWRYLWQALRHDHQLITLDLLGYGFSDKPKNHLYSIQEQADIVENLLLLLGLNKVHIAAHDIGVNITQELLARSLEGNSKLSIHSILFLNGSIFPNLQKRTLAQNLLSSPIGFLLSTLARRVTFEAQFKRIFGEKTKPSKNQLADTWALVSKRNGHKLIHKLMSYVLDRKKHASRWVQALKSSPNLPCLYINGNSDPICGEVMLERFKALKGEETSIGLNEIGHYPHCEAPKQVIIHYQMFLKDYC